MVDNRLTKSAASNHFFAVFVLLIILVLFLHPIFLENRTLVDSGDIFKLQPWNTMAPSGWYPSVGLDGSPTYMFHPSDLLTRDLVRQGSVFGWNPYNGFGAPWIGAMQPAPYFPFKFLQYLLPFWKGANLVHVLLLFMAGLGCFLLAVSMGLGPGPAVFCAVSYMLCQRLFVIMNMPTFYVETLLPIMLFSIQRMVATRAYGWAIAAGWIGGTQFLGGCPETSFIFCFLSAAFFLFQASQADQRNGWRGHIARGVLVASISLLLSGFQLGEFVRYLGTSQNFHSTWYGLMIQAPTALIRFFVPYYFGPPHQPQWFPKFRPTDHLNLSLFCGITTLVLAVIGTLSRQSRNYRWFFLACFIVFVGFDFGFPVFKYLGRAPLFNVMSIAWNAFVIPFSLSALAGLGLQAIVTGERFWAKLWLALGVCLGAFLLLLAYQPVPPAGVFRATILPELEWFAFALFGLLAALALSRHARYRRSAPWLVVLILTAELSHVDGKLAFARHDSHALNPPSLEWFLKNSSRDDRILGLEGVYPADTLLSSRVRDIRHFDAMYPKLYVDYVDAIWPGAKADVYTPHNPDWRRYDSKLLDIAAVRYIFSPYQLSADGSLIDDIMAHATITTLDRRLVNGFGTFAINGDRRRVLFEHPPANVEYKLRVPEKAELLFSIGEEPAAWKLQGEGVLFEVTVTEAPGVSKVVYQRFYDPKRGPSDRRWIDGHVDLSQYSGRTVAIGLSTKAGRNGIAPYLNAWDGWAGLGLRDGEMEKFTRVFGDHSLQIYRNNNAVARVRFVPTARQTPPGFVPADMEKPDFDYRREVMLKDYEPKPQGGCSADWENKVSLQTVRDEPDYQVLRATVPCDGFLVLADLYDTAWRATVDGRPVRIYNANYAFRAIALQRSSHEITCTYSPWTLRLGVPIALLTAIATCVIMVWSMIGIGRRLRKERATAL